MLGFEIWLVFGLPTYDLATSTGSVASSSLWERVGADQKDA